MSYLRGGRKKTGGSLISNNEIMIYEKKTWR